MDGVSSVSCGSLHTVIVKTDGSVWAWGLNDAGQVGNGGTGDGYSTYGRLKQSTPVKVSGLTAGAELPTQFLDVAANAYYVDAVKWAVAEGVTSGASNTTFSPNKTCTTAQILTFLWRSNGQPQPTISNPFSDVTSAAYFYNAAL
jgi:alpha-tubulin suppressor-like RCC1 family protein